VLSGFADRYFLQISVKLIIRFFSILRKQLNIYIKNIDEDTFLCDALILPVTEGSAGLRNSLPSLIAKHIDRNYLKSFSGKQNEILMIPAPSDIKPKRILFVGLGKKDSVTADKIRQAGGKSAVYLREAGIKAWLFPHPLSCL